MEKLTVFAYLPGEAIAVPAGVFHYDWDNLIGKFCYERHYVDNSGHPVSPDLPLSAEEYSTTKFNGYFPGANNLEFKKGF